MSDSLWPHGLHSPWNSPGQNTGVGSLSPLQGVFPTQGLNPGLPHCRQILYQLSHQGSPQMLIAHVNMYQFIPLPHLTLDCGSLSCVGTGTKPASEGPGTQVHHWLEHLTCCSVCEPMGGWNPVFRVVWDSWMVGCDKSKFVHISVQNSLHWASPLVHLVYQSLSLAWFSGYCQGEIRWN